jgi:peroxiredoxin
VKIKTMTDGKMADVDTAALFGSGKSVLFAVPGAFTPTCSMQHLPGFVEKAGEIKAKGVDRIACISVNDAFVMDSWGKEKGTGDDVLMLADGNGAFAKAVGLDFDGSGIGFGLRSQRYAMVVEDGVVKSLHVEEPMKFEVSSAEAVLSEL